MTFAAELAAVRADEIALRDTAHSWTWAQADSALRPLVNALLAHDFRPRRRVAVYAENSGQTLLHYAAATLAGTSAIAVNFHLTPFEAAFVLQDGEADLVLVDDATAERGRQAADVAGIRLVVGGSGLVPGVVPLAEWLADSGDAEPTTSIRPLPTLVYTSGTTGRPKGVELPPTSWVGGDDVREHVAHLSKNHLVSHGRHLVVGPMYHSGPLTGTRLFLGGAPITVLGRFDAQRLLEVVQRDRVASTIVVPTHLQRLLALPERMRMSYDVSSLRFVLQVGAKCPEPVKRAAIEWLGDVLHESYGASEVGTTCMISAEEWLQRPGSVGRAVPPFEAMVLDEDDRPVPPGVQGRLFFRDTTGHGVRYVSGDSDDRTQEAGLFTLGEVGVMDDEGFVWITDRASDMVVSGGVNIYPAEAEQVLGRHPQIAEVACVGVPDDEMGEQLVALVVPADREEPPDPEDVVSWCRDRLTHYKCPRRVEIVDQLLRTGVGKIDKRRIRAGL
ncbi:MAG TPA: AMP-binding protein, partial [Mycobacteriales bacterium]|nr:AMP-binding protein [Mycobacteriales bacterium]